MNACKSAVQVFTTVHAYRCSQDLQGDAYRERSLIWTGSMLSNRGRGVYQRDMQLHVSRQVSNGGPSVIEAKPSQNGPPGPRLILGPF